MVFNTGAALLDAIVLAVVSRTEEGTYGYKITQDVRETIEVSESTLYPVLRRLQNVYGTSLSAKCSALLSSPTILSSSRPWRSASSFGCFLTLIGA